MSRNHLSELIIDLIKREGPITFARFMEMALYHVPLGYYASSKQRIGPEGDFYTSPLAHPAFGALVAVQLEQMWEALDAPARFVVIEMGSGKGVLARDIIDYSTNLSPEFSNALDYVTLDRMDPDPPPDRRNITGCILSNELLDAMPVHRVIQRNGRLTEMYVEVQNDDLAELHGEPSTPRLQQRLDTLGVSLVDGQEAEINLVLEDWLRDISATLGRGYAMTFDYGYAASELYSPKRRKGTLMCHYKHTTNDRPLARVGEQDITAHVDLTSLMSLGERYGLRHCGAISQARFLGNLGMGSMLKGLHSMALSPGDHQANQLGMRNLVDGEGLGRFQVVVQDKGDVSSSLRGLDPEGVSPVEALDLPTPLLTDRHINLLAGRYPHQAWSPPDWDD